MNPSRATQPSAETEIGMGHHWKVHRQWNTELFMIFLGSILGFTLLFAVMAYINAIIQNIGT